MEDLSPQKHELEPIEMASRDEIASLQLQRMKWSLQHAYDNVPHYKASFDKLWGYTNVVRYGTKYLKDNGNIVLVSGSPARKCRAGQIAISSVGGAVEAFARGVAPEIAPKRINIVSPGIIDTPMSPLQGKERKDYYKNTTNNNLIPRAGTPDEVATGIIFAIENEFITGTTIDIDGGWLIS